MSWDYGQYDSVNGFGGILNYGQNKPDEGWKLNIPRGFNVEISSSGNVGEE
jgi:hypothetical protein